LAQDPRHGRHYHSPSEFHKEKTMANNLAHFAIEADDLPRARRFYESVFGWRFTPWGPPDFFQIRTGDKDNPGIEGALQRRYEPLTGTGHRTYICTIGVDALDDIMAKVKRHGGKIADDPYVIVGVGTLIYIEDTESNRVGVMQYDSKAGRDE
jgi:predicted enzyme related to lactoylglutathione lyase